MDSRHADIAIKVVAYLTLALILLSVILFSLVWLKFEYRPFRHSYDIASAFIPSSLVALSFSFFVLNFRKKYLVSLNIIGAMIALHFITTELARFFVHFIAWYITDSNASDVNSLINWDMPLKLVTYGLYAFVFMIGAVYLHVVLMKRRSSKVVNRTMAGIFVLSFPTITSWQISYTCGGFWGNCQRSLNLVTPVVMSINPIYMCISVLTALFAIKLYSKIYNIVIL